MCYLENFTSTEGDVNETVISLRITTVGIHLTVALSKIVLQVLLRMARAFMLMNNMHAGVQYPTSKSFTNVNTRRTRGKRRCLFGQAQDELGRAWPHPLSWVICLPPPRLVSMPQAAIVGACGGGEGDQSD